jgi:hypothetical protein
MKEFSSEWFDDASNEWMKNKRKVKGGSFKYICEYVKDSKKCKRDVKFFSNHSCDYHFWKMMVK